MAEEFEVYRNDASLPVKRLKLEGFGPDVDGPMTLDRNLYSVDMEAQNGDVWKRIRTAEEAGDRQGALTILVDALALALSVCDPDWTPERLRKLPAKDLARFLAFSVPSTLSAAPQPRPTTETPATSAETPGEPESRRSKRNERQPALTR